MFGSNFFGNFGIPEQQPFPYQGADPQGGMLGPNTPGPGQSAAPGGPAAPAAPIAGQGTPPAPPTLGAPSPLAGSPLAPGGGMTPPQPEQPGQAPAAGVGSPFGRPANG